MTKKVTFNGIELSQSKYDKSTLTIFDFLDNLKNRLEMGLDQIDDDFQLLINVDFTSNNPPRHKIYGNASTTKKTEEKVARILKNSRARDYRHVAGSVQVRLLVENRT
jgi:hypothetical protein